MSTDERLLVLWLTGKCNLRCRYCYAAKNDQGEMDLGTARLAVQQMGDTPFRLQFAGGEPLLNLPLLAEILEYIREYRIPARCSLQTNGTLITDEAAEILRAHRVAVGVSLDGGPKVNEKLRGHTQEVLAGIACLARHGMMVNLNAVVTEENAETLADLVDIAIYLGNVNGIGLDLLRIAGRARAGGIRPPTQEALQKGLAELKDRLDARNCLLKRKLVVREFEKAAYYLGTQHPCLDYCFAAQGRSYVVLPDGDCYPCGSLAGDRQYYMGNVHTAVHPVAIQCIRPRMCAACAYAKVCTGGCPSRGLLRGGFDELDCLMKKITFQFAEGRKKEEKL